jgi:hypothetical protein
MVRSRALHGSIALVLFGGLTALASPACGLFECSEQEVDAVVACERITEAVNEVLASCAILPVDTSVVCGGEVCDRLYGCTELAQVNACIEAIGALSCDGAQSRAYATLLECTDPFERMASSCGSDSGGGDWDWD